MSSSRRTLASVVACCAIWSLCGCDDGGGGPSDTTPPDFTDLAVSPDPAKAGDTLTITFTSSEELSAEPDVVVNTNPATFVSVEGEDDPMVPIVYTYSYLVQGTESEATVTVHVAGTDRAGNPGSATSSVQFDFTAPILDVWVSPDPAKAGDTLTIEVHSTDLTANPSVTIAGNPADFDDAPETWKYMFSYVVLASDGDGPATVEVTGTDAVGNLGTTTTSVMLDVTPPTFSDISATPDPASGTDTLTITFTASEALSANPTVTVDGNTGWYDPSTPPDYTYKYTFSGTETEGLVTIEVTGQDPVGNVGTSTGTVTYDQGGPSFGSILCTPDPARSGVTITIEFLASEELVDDPAVTVDGFAATLVPGTPPSYTYTYDVVGPGTETEGAVSVVVTATDLFGHPGTDSTTVTLDFTAPTFEPVAASPDPAKTGDTVTITFTASEALVADPAVTVGGAAATLVPGTPPSYTYTYTVQATEPEVATVIAVSADDMAGNPGTGTGSVTIDRTAPTISDVSATPDPAKAGDTLTITFLASEALAPDPAVTVAGSPADFVSEDTLLYTYSYVVQAGDPEGAAAIAVSADDMAGNPSTGTGSVTIDRTAPTVSGISATPDPAKAGDELTITFTVSETLGEDPVVTVDGNAATFDSEVTLLCTCYYTVQGTDTQGAVVVAVSVSDRAGNPGSDTGSVTLDVIAPAAVADLDVAYSGFSNTVTLTWTAPGDDDSTGTATAYILKQSASLITAANFDAATTVAQVWTPLAAGLAESEDIALTWYSGITYFAIKAEDDLGNLGAVSNCLEVNTDAAASLPGAFYGYGDVAFNTASDHDFVITNTSACVDLVISDIQLTGDVEYSVTAGGLPASVPPGDTHTVTVRFLPTAIGACSGTLSVTHNDPLQTSPYSITLTGTGVNAAPSVAGTDPAPAQAGDLVVLSVDVTDQNSDLVAYDDIASVVVDLTEAGGPAGQAMTYSVNVGTKTGVYVHSLDTTGLPSGIYKLPVTAVDNAAASAGMTLALSVYEGTIRNVPAPYATIQEAITASVDGDMVLVAGGTYTGFGNKDLRTLGKRIVVTSENGAAATIIDCQAAGRGFNFNNTGETNSTVIAGFTIQNGAASALRCFTDPLVPVATSPTIMDCVFTSNTNGDHGGAMVIDGTFAMPRIVGCTFTGNTVPYPYSGGAIHLVTGASPMFGSCVFVENQADSGGAVYDLSGASGTFTDCTFEGNQAALGGGAAKLSGDGSTFTGCSFDYNTAAWDGGAVWACGGAGTDVFSECTFTYNSAQQWGGAIYVDFKACSSTDCLVANNTADDTGGAIHVGRGGSLAATRCTFDSNAAARRGGAIYSYGAFQEPITTTTDCVFSANTAGRVEDAAIMRGGAVCVDNGSLDASNCAFTGNRTISDNGNGSGGAVWIGGYDSMSFTNCLFSANATDSGGALYCGMGNPIEISILNCAIADNNAAAGGGAYFYSGTCTVADTIIWGNTDVTTGAESADQVYARNDATVDVTVSYSDINAAAGNIYDPGLKINSGDGFWPGDAGNIFADPLFVTGPGGGYYLSQMPCQGTDSPCLDTGSDTAANLGLDTRTTRTDGATDAAQVDMGWHYEP